MTDNDDLNSPRDRSSRSDGDDHERPDEARPHGVRAVSVSTNAKITNAAPTDPEVPSAKRRGALRQQRSIIGLAAVVVGLLSITLSLLYRASRTVGAPDSTGGAIRTRGSTPDDDVAPPTIGSGLARDPPPAAMPASRPLPDLPDHFSGDDAPFASSASPPSKNPPPASDMIRRPPF